MINKNTLKLIKKNYFNKKFNQKKRKTLKKTSNKGKEKKGKKVRILRIDGGGLGEGEGAGVI